MSFLDGVNGVTSKKTTTSSGSSSGFLGGIRQLDEREQKLSELKAEAETAAAESRRLNSPASLAVETVKGIPKTVWQGAKALVDDPMRVLATPVIRAEQAIAASAGRAIGGDFGGRLERAANQPMTLPSALGGQGGTIEPQRGFDNGGAAQIAGDTAQYAATIYTGGRTKPLVDLAGKGFIKQAAIQGSKEGAIGMGGYMGGGEAAREGSTAGSIAMESGKGLALGGFLGGVLGGGGAALAKPGALRAAAETEATRMRPLPVRDDGSPGGSSSTVKDLTEDEIVKEVNVQESNVDGKLSGYSKKIIYRTSKNGTIEVDVYIKSPESPNAGKAGAPEGHVWSETMSLTKAQQKFQTTDRQTLAQRIVNPHEGYNYQTETYQTAKGLSKPTPAQQAVKDGLTEDEFNKKYFSQHKDIKNTTPESRQATKDSILKDGFDKQGLNVNTLPVNRGFDYSNKNTPVDFTERSYGNKKGDVVYLLPEEANIKTGNGHVNAKGWKPKSEDVITIEYDGQSSYEAYTNQLRARYQAAKSVPAEGNINIRRIKQLPVTGGGRARNVPINRAQEPHLTDAEMPVIKMGSVPKRTPDNLPVIEAGESKSANLPKQSSTTKTVKSDSTPDFTSEPIKEPSKPASAKLPTRKPGKASEGLKTPVRSQITAPTGRPVTMDIPRKTATVPVREPKAGEAVTKPKAATDINKRLAAAGFDQVDEDLMPGIASINKADQIEKVARLLEDVEASKKMAYGEIPVPDGVAPQVLFNAVKNRAIEEADGVTLQRLATSKIATERSQAAQTLGSSGFNNGPADAIDAMQDITKTRTKAAERRKQPSDAKKEVKTEKAFIKKAQAKRTWDDVVDSLTC